MVNNNGHKRTGDCQHNCHTNLRSMTQLDVNGTAQPPSSNVEIMPLNHQGGSTTYINIYIVTWYNGAITKGNGLLNFSNKMKD